MTTERIEKSKKGPAAGSGRYAKIVCQPHPCVKPDPAKAGVAYQAGTEWTCQCGKSFRLTAGNQRDPGYYWSPTTKPAVQGGNAWDR